MTEVQGITQVDSLYEALGLQAAGRMLALFARVQLPLVFVLASTAWLFVKGAELGTYRSAVAYFLIAVALWGMLGPVAVVLPAKDQPMRFETPRLLYHLNGACDALTAAATDDFATLRKELADDRFGFVLREVRIADARLGDRTRGYLRACAAPEIAARQERGMDVSEYLLLPLTVATFEAQGPEIDAECRKRRDEVREGVRRHLASRGEIRAALSERGDEGRLARFVRRALAGAGLSVEVPISDYMQNVAVARLWAEGAGGGDLARAERSTGGSGVELMGDRHGSLPFPTLGLDATMTAGIHLWSRLSSEIDSRSRRYEIMMHAPKFYGLSLMLAMAAFPIAALVALLPGGWRALANYAKVFVSIKMWPLFWSLLSAFNDVAGEPDVRLVLPSVYAAIPAVSFVFVNLVTAASGAAFQRVSEQGPSPIPAATAMAGRLV
jgi:hypothetical protein